MAPATQERTAEFVQHASRRNTRYTAQAVVDGTRKGPTARTDHDELVDLVGATRVDAGNVCLLRVWGDPHMAPDRIDLAKIKDDDDDEATKTLREGAGSFQWFRDVEQMGCGVDHVVWLRAGCVWGIGNTWNSQVVRRWHKKPSKCLIRFSKPARVDLTGCPNDEEEEEEQKKKDSAKKKLHTRDVANGAEKHSDRETDGTVGRPKEQKVEHLPQKATAVAASRHETCVAYEGELHWSIPRGYREQVFRCIKLRKRVIKIVLHKGSKAQRGGILLTATREALRLRLSSFASEDEKEAGVEAEAESPGEPARKIEPLLDFVADSVDHVGATEDAIVYVQGSKVSYVGSETYTFDVGEDVLELACGLHHSVLLTNERRRVLTWGSNRVGALGLSKSTCLQGGDYKTPQLVNGRLGPFWEKCERVKHVCAGGNYSGFLLEDGRVFLCGELAAGAKLVLRPQLFEIPPYFQVQRLWAGDEYLILQCDAKQDVDGL